MPGGVTAAQLRPMRNASHCIAAGTLEEPVVSFCRMLNRSKTKPSVPVFAELKPPGSAADPKVEGCGLVQSETTFGDSVKYGAVDVQVIERFIQQQLAGRIRLRDG